MTKKNRCPMIQQLDCPRILSPWAGEEYKKKVAFTAVKGPGLTDSEYPEGKRPRHRGSARQQTYIEPAVSKRVGKRELETQNAGSKLVQTDRAGQIEIRGGKGPRKKRLVGVGAQGREIGLGGSCTLRKGPLEGGKIKAAGGQFEGGGRKGRRRSKGRMSKEARRSFSFQEPVSGRFARARKKKHKTEHFGDKRLEGQKGGKKPDERVHRT